MMTFRLIGGNDTKVANAKSCIYKTKYGKMAMINYGMMFISIWLTEQQHYKELPRLI